MHLYFLIKAFWFGDSWFGDLGTSRKRRLCCHCWFRHWPHWSYTYHSCWWSHCTYIYHWLRWSVKTESSFTVDSKSGFTCTLCHSLYVWLSKYSQHQLSNKSLGDATTSSNLFVFWSINSGVHNIFLPFWKFLLYTWLDLS